MDTKLFSSHKKSKYSCIHSVLNALAVFPFFLRLPFFPESVSVRLVCFSVNWNLFSKVTSDLHVAKPISGSQPLFLFLHSLGLQLCRLETVLYLVSVTLSSCFSHLISHLYLLALDIPLFNPWTFFWTCTLHWGVTPRPMTSVLSVHGGFLNF